MTQPSVPQPVSALLAAPHTPLTGPADYILHRTLRQSIYGKVKLASLVRQPNNYFAAKISSLAHVQQHQNLENPEQETKIMRVLSAYGGHPHVLKLFDDFVQPDRSGTPMYHWQILEFCSGGELFDLIDAQQGQSGIGEAKAYRYFTQMLSGLAFIHSRGFAHLDISPENVMLDHEDNVKIIDFGMARVLPPNGVFPACSGKTPGKLAYMAPEIFAGQNFHGPLSDVYSLGVVLFTMLVGFPPYGQPSTSDKRFEMIINGQLHELLGLWGLVDKLPAAAIDLMQRMIAPASKRLTLHQVMAHPWVQGLSELPTPIAQVPVSAASASYMLNHQESSPRVEAFFVPSAMQTSCNVVASPTPSQAKLPQLPAF